MRRLSFKLVLRLWGTTTVLLVLMLAIDYWVSRQDLVEGIRRQALDATSAFALRCGSGLLLAEEMARMTVVHLETHPFSTEAEIHAYLERILRGQAGAYGVGISFEPFGFEGRERLFAPYLHRRGNGFAYRRAFGYDHSQKPWYRVPRAAGTPTWTEPYLDEGGGEVLMITYAAPFRWRGRFGGVATVDVALTDLDRQLARLRLGRSGYGVMVSRGARVIAATRTLPGAAAAELPRELAARIGETPTGFFVGREPLHGEAAWIAFRPIGNTGLKVVAFYPGGDLRRRLYALNRATFFIALGSLAALLLITALNARAIARPVVLLAGAARRVAAGDLGSEPPAVAGRDELAELARSFGTMVRELRAQMRELERSTAEKERFSSELRIAREIQLSILPRTFPPFPEETRCELYARTLPAHEMGGDFYDFFLLPDGRLGLVIADVSDKGMPAAIFMAVSRTLVRTLALRGGAPGTCLDQANALLCHDNESSMFVTLFYGILDLACGELEYANAGHNPPLVAGPDAAARRLDGKPGCPLGAWEEMSYPVHRARLAVGELLFLYTDGITEAIDPADRLFTEGRLAALLEQSARSSPRAVIGEVLAAVRLHAGEQPQFDDITALALAYHGADGTRPC